MYVSGPSFRYGTLLTWCPRKGAVAAQVSGLRAAASAHELMPSIDLPCALRLFVLHGLRVSP